MNGAPLPPNIIIKPISSFDERGRFTQIDTAVPVQEEISTEVQPSPVKLLKCKTMLLCTHM